VREVSNVETREDNSIDNNNNNNNNNNADDEDKADTADYSSGLFLTNCIPFSMDSLSSGSASSSFFFSN